MGAVAGHGPAGKKLEQPVGKQSCGLFDRARVSRGWPTNAKAPANAGAFISVINTEWSPVPAAIGKAPIQIRESLNSTLPRPLYHLLPDRGVA